MSEGLNGVTHKSS